MDTSIQENERYFSLKFLNFFYSYTNVLFATSQHVTLKYN